MKNYIIKPIHFAFLGLMALTLTFSAHADIVAPSDIGKFVKTAAGKFYKLHGTADKPYIKMLGVVSWPANIDDGELIIPVNIDGRRQLAEANLPEELRFAVKGEIQKPNFVLYQMKNAAFHNKSYMLKLPRYGNKPIIFEIKKNGLLRAKVISGVDVKIYKKDGNLLVTNPLTQKKQELTIVDHASSPLEDYSLSREQYFKLYNKYIIAKYEAVSHSHDHHSEFGQASSHHTVRYRGDHHHGGGGGGSGGH